MSKPLSPSISETTEGEGEECGNDWSGCPDCGFGECIKKKPFSSTISETTEGEGSSDVRRELSAEGVDTADREREEAEREELLADRLERIEDRLTGLESWALEMFQAESGKILSEERRKIDG